MVTRYGRQVIDIEPADVEPRAYGAAVDVGTSKVIVYLFDLTDGRLVDQEAIENPQMRYGEDVVTRMTQAVHQGMLAELTAAVRGGHQRAPRARSSHARRSSRAISTT